MTHHAGRRGLDLVPLDLILIAPAEVALKQVGEASQLLLGRLQCT